MKKHKDKFTTKVKKNVAATKTIDIDNKVTKSGWALPRPTRTINITKSQISMFLVQGA